MSDITLVWKNYALSFSARTLHLQDLLVHVTHSLLCVGFSEAIEGGRRNVDCVLFSGCSSNVTTARCAARVGISACLCLGACASTLQMHTSLDWPLQDDDPFPAITFECSHFGRANQPIVQGIHL